MPLYRLLAPILTVTTFATAIPVFAQSDHTMHAQAKPSAPAAAWTGGVVRAIHKQENQVTISHEPLANLGMGKMTMTFRLKSPALVEGIKEGAKIRFVAENVNGELTVIALEAVK